ncbi:SDR family NAD(P)-dependent oxidoreductase [Nocardia sp. NPDC052566]|uniref:SDR family NAD(P)-dependent oxidoreductase n=1 Tax=Nocardia sp. NPDC052566 TaxID=3364330 RepID=UPI0037C936CF
MDERELEYFKRLTTRLRQARERVAELEAARTEPIAVTGAAVRLPGGISSPEALWAALAEGRAVTGDFPADRGWDLEALFGDPNLPGTSRTRRGGFLDDVAGFDADFFGISPREAESMDPQQRILLETAWEALERAVIDPTALRGRDVGVFVGASPQGYGSGIEPGGGHLLTGTAPSVLSGRLAYVLGVHGPVVTVDTACSSSLVAVHQAIRALRAGDCATALAAGITVMSTPAIFAEFSRQDGLAPDGRCKSFAAAADGTGWAEGAVVLVLRRLSDAISDGAEILGLLRGSAVNSDGASNGLTAPSGPAQRAVIRLALADAGLEPAQVDAVEAHGTGTTLGDPIEARALLEIYGQGRERPLWLGSAKSNFGHTQAAAGVVGLLKMLLALRHGLLPRTLHVDRPTAVVDWSVGAVSLLTEAVPWPAGERPRRAGVSSFGVSGTNAHVVVEEAAAVPARPAGERGLIPLVISARTGTALAAQAARLAEAMPDPAGAARTLATARARWDHRAVVVAADPETSLRRLAAGTSTPEVVTGTAQDAGQVVFVFPGQGAQWAGMAADLLAEPVFADRMAECAAALAPVTGWQLLDVLATDPLERTDVLQPVSFAVLVSLAALWESHGVRPAAVIGHSQGELAAACVAGAVSLADAARIVALRSRMIADELAGHGGMLSAGSAADEIVLPPGVEVAAVNSPRSSVLAGDRDALAELEREFRERGVPVHLLPVDYASHTAHVDTIAGELSRRLAGTASASPGIAWMSTVDAEWVTGPVDAAYWVRNLRLPVRFRDAVAKLAAAGYTRFVEVSPHPVLMTAVEETVPEAVVTGTLRRGEGDGARFLRAMGEFWVRGGRVDWTAGLPDVAPAPVPVTVFEHGRYWLDAARAGSARGFGLTDMAHPVLSAVVDHPAGSGFSLAGRLRRAAHPWLTEHVIGGRPLAPGALFVELALQAGRYADLPVVEELVITEPLVLDADADLRVVVAAPIDGSRAVELFARTDGSWVRHASGTLAAAGHVAEAGHWPPPAAKPVALTEFYAELADLGYGYGPAFQGLRRAWRHGGEWYADVAVQGEAAGFAAHPALLDAAMQVGLLGAGELGLPFAWRDVRVYRPGASAGQVRLRAAVPQLVVADAAGNPVLTVGSLTTRPVAASAAAPLLALDWITLPPALTPELEWSSVRPGSVAAALSALRCHPGPRPLVVCTSGADTDPAAAAVCGLVRAAQAERPGLFLLADIDDERALGAVVPRVVAAGETEFRVRDGVVSVPRIGRIVADGVSPVFEGTVLIAGGTGTLGALVAEHLVRVHGVRRLVLVSRRGPAAPGAAALRERLASMARVDVIAADLTDRTEVARVVDACPRLTAVVQATAVFGDALLANIDEARLTETIRAKAEVAAHLDELTRGRGLAAFVLFSSVAGLFANAGQGAYAAANAALDAIAVRRRAEGETAVSIAWGLWAHPAPDGERRAREVQWSARSGLGVLSAEQGLRLFDAALACARPVVIGALPDRGALRELAPVPPLLRAFGAQPAPRPDRSGDEDSLLKLVRTTAATVLGAVDIDADRDFRDAGFDSLTAVELRNRLAAATGLRLSATLVFDHRTPRGLARHLADASPERRTAGAGRGFAEIYRELDNQGLPTVAVAEAAARLRARGEDGLVVTATRLAEGSALPRLICLPSISTWEPALNFGAFADQFRGEAEVIVLVPPGYEDEKPLAASWSALARAMADAVVREAAGQRYLLIGYSSGGGLADTVVENLPVESAPAAVVLVDTYTPDQLSPRLQASFRHAYRGIAAPESVTYEKITASSVYIAQHNTEWRPTATTVPVLALTAREAPPNPPDGPPLADDEWRHAWPYPHERGEIPGDHFSMMTRYAAAVAAAVRGRAALE